MRANPHQGSKNKGGMSGGGWRTNRQYFEHSGKDSAEHREEDPRLTHAPVILDRESPEKSNESVRQMHTNVMGFAPRYSTTPNWCNDYARLVDTGDIIAGPHVRALCRKHLGDWESQWPIRGSTLWFDKGAYDWVAQFAHRWLRFYQGQYYGQPFDLEPPQEFIAGCMFGWRMWREGYPEDEPWSWPRRYRRCYLEMGKGNGKTPIMGLMSLYGLLADKERGAEIYIGASKQKQAHVCFDDAVRMARASPLYVRDGFRVTGSLLPPASTIFRQSPSLISSPPNRRTRSPESSLTL